VQLNGFWDELAGDVIPVIRQFRRDVARLRTQEKPDKTLLTEADLAVEQRITDMIRQLDPAAVIIAEEDDRRSLRSEVLASPEWIWIVDPIDGTAEFVRPDRTEFCSVVCLLRHNAPVAAFVLAPELGQGRTPLAMTADRPTRTVTVNGATIHAPRRPAGPRLASVTRSRNVPPRHFEAALLAAGYALKTRTTSQTLDMVRTAVDLREFADGDLAPFTIFYRPNQKVWDGLAGLCFGEVTGHRAVDPGGRARVPVRSEVLSQPEPTFDATIMGPAEEVAWFVRAVQQEEP
jgi:3'(2'), 5'-bisphosphate nucleotidase